jgi:hypothetical protein
MADGLLDLLASRIFQKQAPSAAAPSPDQMAQIIQQVKGEMPGAAGVDVQPMGPIGKALAPGAYATTSPFGSVSYNPDALAGQSPAQIGDTLAHEFTHASQISHLSPLERIKAVLEGARFGFGGGLPYGQRPEELEAFQAENNRAVGQGRTPDPMPSFSQPGAWQTLGDVQLPAPRKRTR